MLGLRALKYVKLNSFRVAFHSRYSKIIPWSKKVSHSILVEDLFELIWHLFILAYFTLKHVPPDMVEVSWF
jgi:hypothetical protein